MNIRPDFLVFDATNILYRSFYASIKDYRHQITGVKTFIDVDDEEDELTQRGDNISGMVLASALFTFNKIYKKFKPKYGSVMAFDKPSWRVKYTTSDLCLSGWVYKGRRRQNMTKEEELVYQKFKEHKAEFEEIIYELTNIICLRGNLLEADDLIARFVQLMEGNEIVIVSSDKDYLQLLTQDGVYLYNSHDQKFRDLSDFDNDPEYFLFTKLIRGETGSSGDNIQSALPRVRSTRIKKAYNDVYEMEQLKNTTWTNENKKEFRVGDLMEENRLLMDLTQQPEPIINKMDQIIDYELNRKRRFHKFKFLKEVTKLGLNSISKNIDSIVPFLNNK